MGLSLFTREEISKFYYDKLEKKDTVIFIPPIKGGQIIQVYDVNTLIIATKIPQISNKFYRFTIDLKDVEVPSIRSKNEKERATAQFLKELLIENYLHRYISISNLISENNRLKADIYDNNIHINNWVSRKLSYLSY